MYAADEVYNTAELEDIEPEIDECGAEVDGEIEYDHVYIVRCSLPDGHAGEHAA